MTDKQPEALSIAKRLKNQQQPLSLALREKAAAELRRLHDLLGKANALCRIRAEEIKAHKERILQLEGELKKLNDQAEHFERHWYLRGDQIDDLLEALRDFSDYVRDEQCSTDGAVTYSNTQINRLAFKACAAIAKATGENNDNG